MWLGLCKVLVVPSPKSQSQETASWDRSEKFTTKGATVLVDTALKAAVGGGTGSTPIPFRVTLNVGLKGSLDGMEILAVFVTI